MKRPPGLLTPGLVEADPPSIAGNRPGLAAALVEALGVGMDLHAVRKICARRHTTHPKCADDTSRMYLS
ncbi:MAG: hypothetical protein AB7F22_31805 [Reyranella sp.]|uniref:hypothetical protein n=1 Tax=Reyranella sp. TaxID=1929291 RepID=UPI003D0A83B1